MKASIRKTQSVSDLQILFKPMSITFKHPKRQLYKLYLQKNVQVIGEIKQIINSQPRLPTYVFAYDIEPIVFRVREQRIGHYQISLYQFNNGVQNFIESGQFDLDKFIFEYFREFLQSEEQLTTQMIGKKQSSFTDIWSAAKNNITNKVYNQTIQLKLTDAIIEFTCTPQSEYDRLVKLSNLQGEKNKGRKGELTKSKTMPDKLLNPKSPFVSNNYTGSQLIPPSKFDAKKALATNNGYQMQIRITNPQSLSKIEQVEQNLSVPNFITKRQKAVTFDFQNIKREEPILISKDKDQQRQDPTGQNVPQIAINNFRDIKSPQIINSESKIGYLSVSSQISKDSKVFEQKKGRMRQYLGRGCELGIYVFMIMVLMHPISKVG